MLKFSEIPYKRPDAEELKRQLKEMLDAFEAAETYEQAREQFIAKDKLIRHIMTASTIAQIRHSINTKDEFYDGEVNFWNRTVPELQEYSDLWTRSMCKSPFRGEMEKEFGEVVFINAELEMKCFDVSIIPLLQEENDLSTKYGKLIAGAAIPFRGNVYTIAQLGTFKKDADDDVRLEAWLAEGGWYRDHKAELDEIYDRLTAIRHEMSRKLGLKNYVEMGYYRMTRNCYDADDVEKFREAVRKYIVPVAEEIRKTQAKRLGMRYPLSFSDCALLFRSGNPKPAGDADAIMAAADKFYDELSPETSEFFRMMRKYELMDLLSTEGKEGGGYCTGIYDYGVPFIFANFDGTADDVETVTHEAGHAFAEWMNRDRVPLETVWPSMEACEVHSMSMEFFAWKSADDFFGEDKRKFLYSHLAGALLFIPYGTMVDHFQHIVYEHPELTPDERHGEWKRLLEEYMPWLRLDGEIPFYSEGMGWQRQSHIYHTPFYYIDYCLAQTVSLMFWSMMQDDYKNAWDHYVSYTKLGGSDVFTKLLEKAGMKSPFEEDTIREVCGKASAWLDAYDLEGIE